MLRSLVVAIALGFASVASAVTPFELPQMNAEVPGTVFKSADYPDAVFVVETYFLGCPYCNQNAPAVNALADSFFHDTRVHVLDVGIDRSDSDYAEWIHRHNPNHAVLKDANRKLVKQLGTQGYPSTYVIDAKGVVKFKTEGEWENGTADKLKAAIEQTLAEQFLDSSL